MLSVAAHITGRGLNFALTKYGHCSYTRDNVLSVSDRVNSCNCFSICPVSRVFFPLLLPWFLSDPSLDDSGAVSPDQDDTQDGEKTEKHRKKKGKVKKPKKPEHEGRGHCIFSYIPKSSDNDDILLIYQGTVFKILIHPLPTLICFITFCNVSFPHRDEQKASYAHSRWCHLPDPVGLLGGRIRVCGGLRGSLPWCAGAALLWLQLGHQPLRLWLLHWAGLAQTQDPVLHLQRAPRLGPPQQNWQGVRVHRSISGSPLWRGGGSKG